MSQTYFSSLRRLKATLASGGPANRTIGEARGIVGNDKELDRAFWDLADGKSEWLEPLIAQNLLTTAPTKQSEGDRFWYPHWPATRYLTSIANQRPADVADAILTIKSDNPRVLTEFIHAAMAMPIEHGRRLVAHIAAAAGVEGAWMWVYKAGEWCTKLAKESPADAFVLLEALFAPGRKEDEDYQRRSEAFSKRALGDIGDDLTRADAERYLGLIVRWLGIAIERRDGEGFAAQPDRDWSVIWRPAIEEHEQNSDVAEASWLTGLLARACEFAVREGKLSMGRVLEIIAGGKTTVFKRLRIHLINRFADQDPDLARATMMDRVLYDASWAKHEYAELMNTRFELLNPDERRKWMQWVDDGPDMRSFEDSIRERRGTKATDDDVRKHREWRRYERLHTIRDHLTGDDQEFYDRMKRELGEPDLADFVIRSRAGYVQESPVDFHGLTFEQALTKLKAFSPDADQVTGLKIDSWRSGFEQFLAAREDRYSEQAPAMIGVGGIFVYVFLRAQFELAKAAKPLKFGPVLALCEWVVTKNDPDLDPSRERMWSDRPWRDSHAQAAELIKALCTLDENKRPRYTGAEHVGKMRSILGTLCKAAPGSALVESEGSDPRQRDWLDVAINSVRGRAVEALLAFMDWRASTLDPKLGNSFKGDLTEFAPEFALLDWQLDTPNRTVEGLAPLGSRMGLLYVLNRAWLKAHVDQLFPLPVAPKKGTPVDWVAWNSFLLWGRPFKEFYELFEAKYAAAVSHAIDIQDPNDRSGRSPLPKLGEHLIVLYGRGEAGLTPATGLLKKFITRASASLRVHAMEFVGQSLIDKEELPDDVVERFKTLWDAYWASTGREDVNRYPENDLFGSWFGSGRYPPSWSLPILVEVAKIVGVVGPEDEVAEQLVKTGETHTVLSMEALRHMLDGASDRYEVAQLFKTCRPLLKRAIESGGEAEMHARAAIDRLGRLGILKAGELLPEE